MVNTFTCFVAALIFFLGGCNTGISDKSLTFISPDDALYASENDGFSLLGASKPTVIVDSRQHFDYAKSHIADSISMPYGWLNLHVWRLDDVGTIIVMGETYNDSASIAMSKSLLEMGFADVKTLQGGFEAWENAGKPVITKE
jgi:rhodanese-related sulfurtransferase